MIHSVRSGSDNATGGKERQLVLRLLEDALRNDPWFAGEIAALFEGDLRRDVERAVATRRTEELFFDYGKDPTIGLIEDVLVDHGAGPIGDLIRDVLTRLGLDGAGFVQLILGITAEALAAPVDWRPDLPIEFESEAQDVKEDPSPTGLADEMPGLIIFGPRRPSTHTFRFQFPPDYTEQEAERLISEFTKQVSVELWEATGLRSKEPNELALRKAVLCFYLRRVHDFPVRRIATEVLGNPTRRTEVKQAERRVASILGIVATDGDNEISPDDVAGG